jgi:hypothetical protein
LTCLINLSSIYQADLPKGSSTPQIPKFSCIPQTLADTGVSPRPYACRFLGMKIVSRISSKCTLKISLAHWPGYPDYVSLRYYLYLVLVLVGE